MDNRNYSSFPQRKSINRDPSARDEGASPQPIASQNDQHKSCFSCVSWISCLVLILMIICITFVGLTFIPGKVTLLILGIDRTPNQSFVGRSDTIIMTVFDPIKPYIGMLSVPRDLWVTIPEVGENRINTAHFFAEANQAGTGPIATIETIKVNTGIDMKYYLRIRFDGLIDIVDAMGGVDIDLSESMGGYEPGHYHLNGNKALAFARHRLGSDDFFRMKSGQLLMKSMIKQLLTPQGLVSIHHVIVATVNNIDTNLPVWQFPRLIIAILMVGLDNIDTQVIDRDMVTSYTTNEGANVLLPNWSIILPTIDKMFGQ